MVILPVNRKFESWGIPRIIAIILCIVLIILIIAGFVFFFYSQLENLIRDIPSVRTQLDKQLEKLQMFIQDTAGVSPERQISYLRSQSSVFFNSASLYVKNLLLAATEALTETGLVIIYVFFFLFYRDKFESFILRLTADRKDKEVKDIIRRISMVTQQYLGGKLIVMIFLIVYNAAGLMIIGFEDALFWAVFAATLNFIPYIGTFLGGFVPFVLALITYGTLGTPLIVAGIFASGQFIDNNFLTPIIIGSKVNLNPLFTIVSLIIGGLLWGVAGLILFIPFLGIAKVIFDNIPSLYPYGYLIGDEKEVPGHGFIKRIKKQVKNIFH